MSRRQGGQWDLQDVGGGVSAQGIGSTRSHVSRGERRVDKAEEDDGSVWSAEKGEVRFVEVKGPGDSLSETQKVSQGCLDLLYHK